MSYSPLNPSSRRGVSGEPLDLSVVIPVYNEEESIVVGLKTIASVMEESNLRYELVVVDDGSTDASSRLIDETLAGAHHVRIIKHGGNLGHSEALRTGFRATRAKYTTHLDVDLQYDPADVLRFYRYARDFHVPFVASRADRSALPVHRRVVSRCYNALSHVLFGTGSRIDANGLKLIETEILRRIGFSDLPDVVSIELSRGVLDQGYPVSSMPIRMNPRIRGKSSYFHVGRIFSALANVLSLAMQRRKHKPDGKTRMRSARAPISKE